MKKKINNGIVLFLFHLVTVDKKHEGGLQLLHSQASGGKGPAISFFKKAVFFFRTEQ